MNALFALALLVSPSQAGVVMSVEIGLTPARPSAPIVPIGSPAGGLIGAPSFGGLDLRGLFPMLPSPVPGLIAPGLNFVGNVPEAAAVKPELGAARVAPAPAVAHGRRADQTPAMPAKVSPGAPALAISSDRKAVASTPGNGQSLTGAASEETPANPLLGSASLEHARPEKAAGLGRKFFDQGSDENLSELSDGAASSSRDGKVEASVIAQRAGGSAFGGGLTATQAGTVFGAGRATGQNVIFAPEGETLHDAVASVPGAAAPRGAVSFFRSASRNGELTASAGAAGTAVLGFPRPLALDLSRSGLIVRVRSALNGVFSPLPAAAVLSPLPAPGPSTALLERGAMLEAFSVARAYAETSPDLQSPAPRAAAPVAPLSPVAERSSVPLWWAWFLLPLFVAAIRGIL